MCNSPRNDDYLSYVLSCLIIVGISSCSRNSGPIILNNLAKIIQPSINYVQTKIKTLENNVNTSCSHSEAFYCQPFKGYNKEIPNEPE